MTDALRHRSVDQAILDMIVRDVRGVDVLSSLTVVDAIEVIGSVVKVAGQGFEGVANLHCTLRYDECEDHFTLREEKCRACGS